MPLTRHASGDWPPAQATPIERIAALMAEERIKRVPVIADGGLVGMVVENPEGVSCRVRRVELDGSELPSAEISMLGDGRQWFCCSEVGGQRGRVDH